MKKHLLQAAERGDAEAQFNLAIMCENDSDDSRYGIGGRRAEAMQWLRAAANQGLPRAQVKLAEIYAGEPDTPDSTVRAYGWYLLARARLTGAPREKAQLACQGLAARLTPAQTAEAVNFARDWNAGLATERVTLAGGISEKGRGA